MILEPIPVDARAADPRWAIAFLNLAQGLVIAGAKAKIIARFTDLPRSKIKDMYKALRGTHPPAGPVVQASPRYFAVPSRKGSAASRIQVVIFLGCYHRLSQITTTPLHRGWLLLAAYNSYLSLTQKLYEATSVKRLDINQAYALLTYSGFLTSPSSAELQLRQCPNCSINYPVVVKEPVELQACPVCAISANFMRLAHQASRLERDASMLQSP